MAVFSLAGGGWKGLSKGTPQVLTHRWTLLGAGDALILLPGTPSHPSSAPSALAGLVARTVGLQLLPLLPQMEGSGALPPTPASVIQCLPKHQY